VCCVLYACVWARARANRSGYPRGASRQLVGHQVVTTTRSRTADSGYTSFPRSTRPFPAPVSVSYLRTREVVCRAGRARGTRGRGFATGVGGGAAEQRDDGRSGGEGEDQEARKKGRKARARAPDGARWWE
jgi:hypothetical protein